MYVTEWQETKSVWLRWPSREDIWPERGRAVQVELLALIAALTTRQVPVNLQVGAADEARLKAQLEIDQSIDSRFLTIHCVDFGEVWLRDCAPFIVRSDSEQSAAFAYNFDGWGGIDDHVAADISARDWLIQQLNLPVTQRDMVLEGGAVHHDGEGTALICTGSILYRQANQGLTAAELATELKTALGIDKVLTLPGRLNADETGGHIDNLACFIAPTTVVVAATQDPSHPDYATCRRVVDFLNHARDAKGRTLTVHTLPLPRSPRLSAAESASIAHRPGIRKRIAGMALMASYVNFLRIERPDRKLIVLPSFGLPTDAQAQHKMQTLLPEHEVLLIPARSLLVGGGAWHCASFVEPA